MSNKRNFKYGINRILKHSKEGSYVTQANRRKMLLLFAEDLYKHTPYKLARVDSLSEKHIRAVIDYWKDKGIQAGTLKNRTSCLRFLSEKINKPNIMPSNDVLGIPKRSYVSPKNRAQALPNLNLIEDEYLKLSLQFQRLFGLRREESLKIIPSIADEGNKLHLLGSWCKGGRERSITIRHQAQRDLIDKAKVFVSNNHSLIPPNKSYKQQYDYYDNTMKKLQLRNLHGLRHAYAQELFRELTGFNAPMAGGPSKKELSAEQRVLDKKARLIISEHLGHSRPQIVSVYCGK